MDTACIDENVDSACIEIGGYLFSNTVEKLGRMTFQFEKEPHHRGLPQKIHRSGAGAFHPKKGSSKKMQRYDRFCEYVCLAYSSTSRKGVISCVKGGEVWALVSMARSALDGVEYNRGVSTGGIPTPR